MAKHGESKHFKRTVVTGALVIPRKKYKYFVRQYPGKHRNKDSVALSALLRDVMKIVDNAKEARFLIKNGYVTVDGRTVKEEKFGVGFGDLIGVKGDRFEISVNDRGKITVVEDKRDGSLKLVKIVSKLKGRGGNTVLFTNDGRNMIQEGGKGQIGDSALLNVLTGKIDRVIPLEQGAEIFIFTGKNAGKRGKVVEISGDSVVLESKEGKFVSTQASCMAV